MWGIPLEMLGYAGFVCLLLAGSVCLFVCVLSRMRDYCCVALCVAVCCVCVAVCVAVCVRRGGGCGAACVPVCVLAVR